MFITQRLLALESEGAPVEFRNVRIKELPSTGATAAEFPAPLDQGWNVSTASTSIIQSPAGAESKWKASNWNLKLDSTDGQEGTPLWSDAEITNGEFIADLQLSKTADLSKPCTGSSTRGTKTPAVLIDDAAPSS